MAYSHGYVVALPWLCGRFLLVVDNEKVEVGHVVGELQKTDILTKALGRIKYKEMRKLVGVQDVNQVHFKLKGEIVG